MHVVTDDGVTHPIGRQQFFGCREIVVVREFFRAAVESGIDLRRHAGFVQQVNGRVRIVSPE
jgi:hypothetical protein